MVTAVINSSGKTGDPLELYIGRGSPWGSVYSHIPIELSKFQIRPARSRQDAVVRYVQYLIEERPDLIEQLPRLRGRTLVCYCMPELCHGTALSIGADEGVDAMGG